MSVIRHACGSLLCVCSLLPATQLATASEAPSRKLRWNIASYLYLLNYGVYEQAASEANIDYAARLGFNSVRFNLWWHEIFPDAADEIICNAFSHTCGVVVNSKIERRDCRLSLSLDWTLNRGFVLF